MSMRILCSVCSRVFIYCRLQYTGIHVKYVTKNVCHHWTFKRAIASSQNCLHSGTETENINRWIEEQKKHKETNWCFILHWSHLNRTVLFTLQENWWDKISCQSTPCQPVQGHRSLEPIPVYPGRGQETPWTGQVSQSKHTNNTHIHTQH